ncbi:SGNH/GDSL hydrolase family protein [Lutimaribacter sp. EGI FJ00015]|uniref:SGNH/GDSL hydrolase family protein n=1 Tax=Lutimaribacter degradans TaxID=2945989 RepID=A0ACC5ZWP0_9RHOB|nr:SGNH/GDSL hydrolase family protein [Lutimaribacter sp. EGI FJ00013]MCM2562515.1 SGNH/GDSL hydrolase family protein [Lutimaribacter sp. EGI FJ00013]MCO0613672.1 SGNH/GDSL hydrolase family protein [Lutimaribacter sp. EGI FJ00015]MCO0636845.1 SGNH/GDSL hydrolase family protein [Lutimaribacter sp. EGI FJ00014]
MATRYAKYALAPVLAVQGAALRRHALRLPEPPGPRQGLAGDGPALSLLIAGDSSAAGVGAPHQDTALSGQLIARLALHRRVAWALHAHTGDTTAACLERLRDLPPARFDVAILALGVNDVTRGLPRRIWLRRQKAVHDLLRHKFGTRAIYASGLPPMGGFPLLKGGLRWIMGGEARRFDTALALLAAQTPDLHHVPFDQPLDPTMMAADGFHPGPRVYALWAEALAARILRDGAT